MKGSKQSRRLAKQLAETGTGVFEQKRARVNCVDDQVQGSVSIQVSKRGPGGVFPGTIHAVRAGCLGELPTALVQVKMVWAVQSAQVNITQPIAIDIPQRHPRSVQIHLVL